MDAYADAELQFIAREAALGERRAALLGRTEGRAVDGFGFSTAAARAVGGQVARDRRATNHEARKRRLQIARWRTQAKREWEAEVPEGRRRAWEESIAALRHGDSADGPGHVVRRPRGTAFLLATATSTRPASERGEAECGAQITLTAEIEKRAAELHAAQEASEAAGEGEDAWEPACEHHRFWNAGVEAFDAGTAIGDCPHEEPSAAQDDWLKGWLTAQLDAEA